MHSLAYLLVFYLNILIFFVDQHEILFIMRIEHLRLDFLAREFLRKEVKKMS